MVSHRVREWLDGACLPAIVVLRLAHVEPGRVAVPCRRIDEHTSAVSPVRLVQQVLRHVQRPSLPPFSRSSCLPRRKALSNSSLSSLPSALSASRATGTRCA
jgi:hypothetical protein